MLSKVIHRMAHVKPGNVVKTVGIKAKILQSLHSRWSVSEHVDFLKRLGIGGAVIGIALFALYRYKGRYNTVLVGNRRVSLKDEEKCVLAHERDIKLYKTTVHDAYYTIMGLRTNDPVEKTMSAQQVHYICKELGIPWDSYQPTSPTPINKLIARFKVGSNYSQQKLALLANLLSSGSGTEKAKRLFRLIDTDCSGSVQRSQFLAVYREMEAIAAWDLIVYTEAAESNTSLGKKITTYL